MSLSPINVIVNRSFQGGSECQLVSVCDIQIRVCVGGYIQNPFKGLGWGHTNVCGMSGYGVGYINIAYCCCIYDSFKWGCLFEIRESVFSWVWV